MREIIGRYYGMDVLRYADAAYAMKNLIANAPLANAYEYLGGILACDEAFLRREVARTFDSFVRVTCDEYADVANESGVVEISLFEVLEGLSSNGTFHVLAVDGRPETLQARLETEAFANEMLDIYASRTINADDDDAKERADDGDVNDDDDEKEPGQAARGWGLS